MWSIKTFPTCCYIKTTYIRMSTIRYLSRIHEKFVYKFITVIGIAHNIMRMYYNKIRILKIDRKPTSLNIICRMWWRDHIAFKYTIIIHHTKRAVWCAYIRSNRIGRIPVSNWLFAFMSRRFKFKKIYIYKDKFLKKFRLSVLSIPTIIFILNAICKP